MKKKLVLLFTILILFFTLNAEAQFKIILNFDDGYQGIYKNAFPALKKANMPAVVFMPTNFINQENHLTLSQLKEIKNADWEIGSHTVNHPNLADLTIEGLKHEIIDSKNYLDKEGLVEPDYISFCSPMTVWNDKIAKIVREYYQIARAKELYIFNQKKQISCIHQVILKNTSIKTIKRWIKEASSSNQLLILIFHEVEYGGNEYYFPPDKFTELISLLSKYDVITFQELYTDHN